MNSRLTTPNAIRGLRQFVANTRSVYVDRPDLWVAHFPQQASVGAVFTTNQFPAAPIYVAKKHLEHQKHIRALVVNAGNANAFTGQSGINAATAICTALADALRCQPCEVIPASTGITAEPLDPIRLTQTFSENLLERLACGASLSDASQAIRTTDAFPKTAIKSLSGPHCDQEITVACIAKGCGMIAPKMSTMLSFVIVDACIDSHHLQTLLKTVVGETYNNICVDGDASTNDTVLLLATNDGPSLDPRSPRWPDFAQAVHDVCAQTAQLIVTDGEGAQRLMELTIEEAKTNAEARTIGTAILRSPLVKTSLHGSDPNWGRIAVAAGGASVRLQANKVNITIGKVCVMIAGNQAPLSPHEQKALKEHWQSPLVEIRIHLGLGTGRFVGLGCDLNHRYIDINTAYKS